MTSRAIGVNDIDEAIFIDSFGESDDFAHEVPAFVQQAKVEGLGAATGAFVALGLEGAVGFGVYFIWQLLHTVR